MAEVRLLIASREYIVTCQDGEEERLQALGSLVDSKAREAGSAAGGLNESRQLLFAALLLADQLQDLQSKTSNGNPGQSSINLSAIDEHIAAHMAQTLEKIADRMENLAQGLEEQP